MGGGLKSLRGLTKSLFAANRGRAPLGGLKRDFTLLNRKETQLCPTGAKCATNGSRQHRSRAVTATPLHRALRASAACALLDPCLRIDAPI